MRPRIGIFGWPEDEQTLYLADWLRYHGAEASILDTRGASSLPSWVWSLEEIRGPQGLRLDQLHAVYVQATALGLPDAADPCLEGEALIEWTLDWAEHRARHGWILAVQAALQDRGVLCVNPPGSYWLHSAKAQAVRVLRDLGLPTPRTLVSASPGAVRDFVRRVGPVIYKPIAGGGSCSRLEAEELASDRLELLRRVPCLFQEFVPGENLRVFVLGEEVVSVARIESEEVDYRSSMLGVAAATIPPEVARQAIGAARAFGLHFTGIDLRLTAGGKHVFLDVNPSPHFVLFERGTLDPIADRLARYLIERGRRRVGVLLS